MQLRHGIFAALDQLIWLIQCSCCVESRPLHGRRHRYKSLINEWRLPTSSMKGWIINHLGWNSASEVCSWRGETVQRISRMYLYFASPFVVTVNACTCFVVDLLLMLLLGFDLDCSSAERGKKLTCTCALVASSYRRHER